jgi:hypothetical protein
MNRPLNTRVNTRVRQVMFCTLAGVASLGTSTLFADPAADTRDKVRAEIKYAGDRGAAMIHNNMLSESIGATVRNRARTDAGDYKDLKKGVGLVVEEVTPGSKAAQAGLQKGDIIFKVGDQWVINTPQFCTLLAIQDANDTFEVKVYRGTERVDLNFKFDQTALDTMNRMHDDLAMASPDSRVDRTVIRGDGADVMGGQAGLIIPEKFSYADDTNRFDLRTEDGVKKLTVKDKDGNVIFDGPYNTQAERDALPADIKVKFERVLREKVK